MTERNGYQPIKTTTDNITPPKTGSNVKAKKHGYTWEEMDKSWWEGFDTCKEKMSKKIKRLEAENKQAKEIIRDFLSVAIDYIDKEDKNYSIIVEAEAFINKE